MDGRLLGRVDIGGIRERVEELAAHLRDRGAVDEAARIERIARGFTHVTGVRRAVTALAEQLSDWRSAPGMLPTAPSVLIAANRLEDACQAALDQGVIAPAPVPLSARIVRLLGWVARLATLALLAMLVVTGLAPLGVATEGADSLAQTPTARVTQGQVERAVVRFVEAPVRPAQTTGAAVAVAGCRQELARGGCRPLGTQPWPEGEFPTFEQRLANEVYGLRVAVAEGAYGGRGVGTADLWVAAAPETPAGTYRIALTGAYVGYEPPCPWWKAWVRRCSGRGSGRHVDRPVPDAVIEVTAATDAQRLRAQAEATRAQAIAQQEAESRAALIVESADVVIAELERLERLQARRQHERVRRQLDRLSELLTPLNSRAAAQQRASAGLPRVVNDVRRRVDGLAARAATFEDRVFDALYEAQYPSGAATLDDAAKQRALRRVARGHRVSRQYAARILEERQATLQARLAAAYEQRRIASSEARQALVKRCGALPADAFQRIEQYLARRHRGSGGVRLRECSSPQLTRAACWQLRCEYRTERKAGDRTRVTRLRAAFRLRAGRVVGHGDPDT